MQDAVRACDLGGLQEGDDLRRIEAEIEFFLQCLAGGIRQLQTIEHHMINMEHQAVDRLLLYGIAAGQRQ